MYKKSTYESAEALFKKKDELVDHSLLFRNK